MISPSKREIADPNKASGAGELAIPPLNVISTKAIQPKIQALWKILSAKETLNVFADLVRPSLNSQVWPYSSNVAKNTAKASEESSVVEQKETTPVAS